MSIYETISSITINGRTLPARYSHFPNEAAPLPPFLVYLGAGQEQFEADNTVYWKRNVYTVEYYFEQKDEEAEEIIEQALLDAGYQYDKSDDSFIESEGLFVIYYSLQ